MSKYRKLALFAVVSLFWFNPVKADSLSGTLTGLPNETISYNLQITSTFIPLSGGSGWCTVDCIMDSISGMTSIFDKHGNLLFTHIFEPTALYLFGVGTELPIIEIADPKPCTTNEYDVCIPIFKYDLVATGLNQEHWVLSNTQQKWHNELAALELAADPPTATPEATAWTLLLCGWLLCFGLSPIVGKMRR
jgi:hypothetical protein